MPDSQKKYPYARLKAMEEFMSFVQEPDWKPPKIDTALFKQLGMAKGKEGEAVATLRFLGVITQEGEPTEDFDKLKQDYQGTVKRLVRSKYSDLFSLIPAGKVTQARLVNYFGQSVDTAEYKAKLFVWFCEQGGIELPKVEKRFHRARFDKEEAEEQE